MDFERLKLESSPKPRMMLQRVIAVVVGVVIFSFIASTLRPDSSSAAEKPDAKRPRSAGLTAGGQRPTASIKPSRMETGGRTAPLHPRGLRPLGNMMSREYLTWIYASSNGPRFTVCRPDGDVLAEDLTAEQVYAQFPDLDIQRMVTPSDAAGGPLMVAPERE